MAVAILFGAGASYGSDAVGTPPLGAQLFDALADFNPAGWGALPAALGSQFRADFEGGMIQLSESHPHGLPPLQRAMAAYFFNFVPGNTNLYVRFGQRIAAASWDGAICTLNYERLLELALGAAGLQPTVGAPTDPSKTVELCLPHGCCHLFCQSVRGISSSVSFAGMHVRTNGPVVPIASPGEFQDRIQGDAFPPVMSYFEPAKTTTSGSNFITSQRSRWAELAAQSDTVALVGIRVRPQDAHIWDPLARTSATLVYCGGSSALAEFEAWSKQHRARGPDRGLSGYFADEFEAICQQIRL